MDSFCCHLMILVYASACFIAIIKLKNKSVFRITLLKLLLFHTTDAQNCYANSIKVLPLFSTF